MSEHRFRELDQAWGRIQDHKTLMNKRQEFIDWARERFAEGQTELAVATALKSMNTFYLWVFDHISTTHLDTVLSVEAWAIVSAAKAK